MKEDYVCCSICGRQIYDTPHTSLPVTRGLCCDTCFKTQVKPRVDFLFKELNRVK